MTSGRASGLPRAQELREILDAALEAIDNDPEDGPRLRAAVGSLRFEFPDLKLFLNVRPAEGGALRWDFSRRVRTPPKLRLSMESGFANRLLQGRENPAIAIARGRMRTTVEDAGAALRFFPAVKVLSSRYRAIIADRYPHLTVD